MKYKKQKIEEKTSHTESLSESVKNLKKLKELATLYIRKNWKFVEVKRKNFNFFVTKVNCVEFFWTKNNTKKEPKKRKSCEISHKKKGNKKKINFFKCWKYKRNKKPIMTIADSLQALKMQMKNELSDRQNEFLMYGYGISFLYITFAKKKIHSFFLLRKFRNAIFYVPFFLKLKSITNG